jgi:hypothetical protein
MKPSFIGEKFFGDPGDAGIGSCKIYKGSALIFFFNTVKQLPYDKRVRKEKE